jgi:hypothetical protein
MADPPLLPGPAGAPPGWDSLSFGGPERPDRRRPSTVVGLLAAGVLVLAGDGLAASELSGTGARPRSVISTAHPAPPSMSTALDGSKSNKPLLTRRPVPPATAQPTGLGTDPTFDRFARECYKGVMYSCDVLYVVSAPRSRYETYGDSCAGRQPRETDIYCTTQFPGA